MNDSNSILFGMSEIAVVKVERVVDDEGKPGRLVHIERTQGWAACPGCGVVSTTVRQRRTTRPRDLPYGEEPVGARWRKFGLRGAALRALQPGGHGGRSARQHRR